LQILDFRFEPDYATVRNYCELQFKEAT